MKDHHPIKKATFLFKSIINTQILILVFLMFSILEITAQELPEIIPPSPEAAALGEFTNVPVSYYTGLPSINVPIYTISEKGITIPIQLSYHARGVKVSEIAPRTGTGWSLQYGGNISRQTRGKPDEHPHHGYLNNKNTFINYANSIGVRGNQDSMGQEDSSFDYYPDQFSFSAGNISGKFILDYTTGDPIVQSFDDIKVTYTRESGTTGRINAFTIVDAKGNTYYFGISKYGGRLAQDYQHSEGVSVDVNNIPVLSPAGGGSFDVYSSWKLMDIETVNGNIISYFYSGEYGANSSSIYYRKLFDNHNPNAYLPPNEEAIINSSVNSGDISTIRSRYSKVWNYEKHLDKITFNKGKDSIVFRKSSTTRLDFDGYALDKIAIYSNNQLIKAFNLNYDFTTSSDTSNMLAHYVNNGSFSKMFSRMFLKSVQQEAANGDVLPPYTFTYDQQILPALFSTRQDYWGYYNGATNNGPFNRMFEYGNYIPDRRVDITKSEAGLLKEIQYPTGGKTLLTYEHNIGAVPIQFHTVKIPNINPGSQDEIEIVLTKADFFDAQGNSITPQIDIPNKTLVSVQFNCTHILNEGTENTLPDCLFYFSINGSPVNYGNDSQYELGQEISTYIDTDSSHPSLNINAFPIRGINPSDLHLSPQYDFQVVINYDTLDLKDNLYGPGKRIKMVENVDEHGNSIIKEYEYNFNYFDDITQSYVTKPSGAIVGLPSYINTTLGSPPYYIPVLTTYNDMGSSYSSFQQNSIGYGGIIEYYGTKTNNLGKTHYTFTNISDAGGDYHKFPYHPPTDNEWLRGKLIKTEIFKNENGIYTLVKDVYNKYLYGNNEYTQNFEFAGFTNPNFVFTPNAEYYDWTENSNTPGWVLNTQPAGFENTRTLHKLPLFMRQRFFFNEHNTIPGYRIYYLTGGTVHLASTTERNYLNNNIIEKTTTTAYNYNNHYQPKAVTTVTSDGIPIKQTYNYTTDLVNTSTGVQNNILQTLVNQNRILPIETRIFKDNNGNGNFELSEELSRTKTIYGKGNTSSAIDIIEPIRILTSRGLNLLEPRIDYELYDDEGNILQVKKTDGTPITYIWGYNNTLPVAKIENATYAEIEALSNFGNNFTLTEALSNAQENQLRNISNILVSTYTYELGVGLKTVTDPRGQTIYYEYDAFNRLKHVKDQDGNILSQNEYNYRQN